MQLLLRWYECVMSHTCNKVSPHFTQTKCHIKLWLSFAKHLTIYDQLIRQTSSLYVTSLSPDVKSDEQIQSFLTDKKKNPPEGRCCTSSIMKQVPVFTFKKKNLHFLCHIPSNVNKKLNGMTSVS